MSKDPFTLHPTEAEAAAWGDLQGKKTTLEWYTEDLNDIGRRSNEMCGFHDGYVARNKEVAALKERVMHFKALAFGNPPK